MLSMKLIASREMAAKPAALWKTLKKEGAVLVTKNGQPEGFFVSTSGETWLEDVQEIVFSRARRAVQEMRTSAAQSGAALLTDDQVDSLIRSTRSGRKR